MFAGKNLWDIIQIGGFTMYILIFTSILSIAVIIERYIYLSIRGRIKRTKIIPKLAEAILAGKYDTAKSICETTKSTLSSVALAGITYSGHDEKIVSNAMSREVAVETVKLEKNTAILGTIGNIAVYIGLFGTVLGIIRAFHDISVIGSGGMNIVIGGVSEALICTATGLLVAIPASIFYNYFSRKIDTMVTEMELCSSEILDLITTQNKRTGK
ncbi:MAG: MotA/TolQ/ExbB proton channel family protein [Elusimicrobiota bacterium]